MVVVVVVAQGTAQALAPERAGGMVVGWVAGTAVVLDKLLAAVVVAVVEQVEYRWVADMMALGQ